MQNGIALVEEARLQNSSDPREATFRFFDFWRAEFMTEESPSDKMVFNFAALSACEESFQTHYSTIECVWYDMGLDLIYRNFIFDRNTNTYRQNFAHTHPR